MLQHLLMNNNIRGTLGLGYDFHRFKFGEDRRNKRTNSTNLELADKNNQAQIDLWQQQKEYDYQMWKENNEYNTPQAQSERLKAAGINPALAMSNISTGTSSSSAGGQTPPTLERPTVDYQHGLSTDVQNIALIGSQLSQIGKTIEEQKAIQTQNFWQDINGLQDMNVKSATEANIRSKTVSQLIQNHFDKEVYLEKVGQFNSMGKILMHQSYKASAESGIAEWTKQHMQNVVQQQDPQTLRNLQQQFSDIYASVLVKYKSIEVMEKEKSKITEEVKKIASDKDLIDSKKKEQDWHNYVNDNTTDYVIDQIKSQSNRTEFDNTFGLGIDIFSKLFKLGIPFMK